MEAVNLYVDVENHKKALKYAAVALALDKDCLGEDHTEYQKRLEIVHDLKGLIEQSR